MPQTHSHNRMLTMPNRELKNIPFSMWPFLACILRTKTYTKLNMVSGFSGSLALAYTIHISIFLHFLAESEIRVTCTQCTSQNVDIDPTRRSSLSLSLLLYSFIVRLGWRATGVSINSKLCDTLMAHTHTANIVFVGSEIYSAVVSRAFLPNFIRHIK